MYEDEDLQEIHEDIIELNEDISDLRRDLNNISVSVEGSGENVTLNGTAEARFKKPPLPMGNSEQEEIFYIETTIKKGFIDSEGNVRADSNLAVMTDYIPVFPNTLYNINRSISTSYTNIRFFDKNKDFLGTDSTEGIMTSNKNNNRMLANETSLSMTILNNNVAFMVFNDYSNDLNTTYTISTLSPSPDYPQEITNVTGDVEVKVQNKNLFDGSLFSSLTRNEDGTYKTNTAYTAADYVPMKLKPNTQYVISLRDVNYNLIGGDFGIYVDDTYIGSTNNMYKFTSSSEITNIKIAASGWSTVGTVNRFIQLEENSTATPYTPHKEQVFTFPLGNEKLMLGDYLADDGIHHKTRELNLAIADMNNGEDFSGWTNLSQLKTDYPSINSSFTAAGINYKSNISNKAYRFNLNTLHEGVMWLPLSYWGIKQTQWKTNYPNLILKFQYELKEEEVVPYTSAQQEVYNQIKEAISYDEQTNVSSNTIALFNIKAFRNMSTSIESLQSRIELLKGRS